MLEADVMGDTGEFRKAKSCPYLDSESADRIAMVISNHACFSRRRASARKTTANHPRRATVPQRRVGSADSPVARAVTSDLNKLSPDNMDRILMKIRMLASPSDSETLVRHALDRAYNNVDGYDMYVLLVLQILAMPSSPASLVDIIRSDVPSSKDIVDQSIVPDADPNTDYDAFCKSCKDRRRVVGRGVALLDLLSSSAVSETAGIDAGEVYSRHEDALVSIIVGREVSRPDVAAAVDLLLDFVSRAVKKHAGMRPAAVASLSKLDLSALNNRCRFKAMDILGR